MNVQNTLPVEDRVPPQHGGPHVIAPPPQVVPAEPTGPRPIPPRARGSVLLHWLMMAGGFAAILLLGKLIV